MKKNFATKAVLALLVVIMLLGSVSMLASAEDSYKNLKLAYGEIVPTDKNLKAQKSSYSFYGDNGAIYFMRISTGKSGAKYAIEMYSDSSYLKQIKSYTKSFESEAGSYPFRLDWPFGELKSGTYYGKCYVFTDGENGKIIDTSSLNTFTVKINRVGKTEVKLNTLVNSATGPKLTWSKLPTADKYYVYRKAAGETKWTRLTTLGSAYSSYTDKTAKSGVKYTYTVKCYDGKFVSLYNKTGLSTYYLATPKLSNVSGSGAAGSAKIKWSAVSGAQGYRVYRKGGSLSDSQWKLLAIVKNGKTTQYVDKTATSTDWRYTYTVKAYYGKYVSYYDKTGVNFDYITAPALKKTEVTYTGVKITWSANNENIEYYRVYRKNGSSWKLLGKTTEKSFIDTTAQSGKTYTYTVKAYSDTNAGAYSSKGITQKFLAAPVLSDLTFNSAEKSVVKWNAVSGASGYRVYRKIDNASKWTLIATIKNGKTTAYYDSIEKTSGTSYTYTVRAFDSNKMLSSFNSKGTTGIFLSKPVFTVNQLVTSDDSLAMEIKWEAVNGATKYNVYRRIPGESWSVLARGITETSFIDTAPVCGIEYEYTVRAGNDSGHMSAYTAKTAMAVLIPTLDTVTVTEEGTKLTWAAVENADLYTVYRMPKSGDAWVAIGTTDTAEFTDTSDEGKTQPFYYTVSATYGEKESATKAGLPNFIEVEVTAELVAATEEKAAHIAVSFDAPAAESLAVYKSVNGEAPVYLEGVTGAFEDTAISEGNAYTYTVSALALGKLVGEDSATVKYPLPPLNAPVISSVESDYNNGEPFVTLTWSQVEFADEYIIYRAEGDGEFVEIATVKAEEESDTTEPETPETDAPDEAEPVSAEDEEKVFTYTDNDVSAEISYSYKVAAVATESERDSAESESVSAFIYTPLDGVTGIKFSAEKKSDGKIYVTVTWDETKYAETYYVHRKAADGDWVLVGYVIPGTNVLACTDNTAKINVEYTYRVTAASVNRGEVSNSETYCWVEESYFSALADGTYIYNGMLVTAITECSDTTTIATVKDGYTTEAVESHDGLYGTGSVIKIFEDSKLVTTYTLIVKGDVNGDSVYDVLDYAEIEKMIEEPSSYSLAQKMAADINGDGEVTDEDIFEI